MSYIIVWRDSHREPFIDVNGNQFKEDYGSNEEAREAAEELVRTENDEEKSLFYFDYNIYQEVDI